MTNRFNKYFANIIKKLNLKKDTATSVESQESCRIIKNKFVKDNLDSSQEFSSYIPTKFAKCLFTNMRKQLNILKISLLFKKNASFTVE